MARWQRRVREFELLCDETTVYLWWERSKTPAWGLFDGHDGAPPEVVINPDREDVQHRFKSAGIALGKGDVVRGSTGGGGGYGDPARRARTAIEEDIANRDLTIEAARRLYGYEGGIGVRTAQAMPESREDRAALRRRSRRLMLDGIFVFDNAIHCYDLSDDNLREDRPDAEYSRDLLSRSVRADAGPTTTTARSSSSAAGPSRSSTRWSSSTRRPTWRWCRSCPSSTGSRTASHRS